jgi:hypothetical protein
MSLMGGVYERQKHAARTASFMEIPKKTENPIIYHPSQVSIHGSLFACIERATPSQKGRRNDNHPSGLNAAFVVSTWRSQRYGNLQE